MADKPILVSAGRAKRNASYKPREANPQRKDAPNDAVTMEPEEEVRKEWNPDQSAQQPQQ